MFVCGWLLLADLDRCCAYYLLLVGLLMPLLPMPRAIFKSICSIGWASVRFLLLTKFYGTTYNNKIAGSVRVHFYASLSPPVCPCVRVCALIWFDYSHVLLEKFYKGREKNSDKTWKELYVCVCVCAVRIAIMCIWFGFSSLWICFVHGISPVCLILFTLTQLFSTFCLIIKKANGRIGHKL